MKQHLPFKPENFSLWAKPKLLPAAPNIAEAPPTSNPSVKDDSYTMLHIAFGVLAIAVIVTTIYLVYRNHELSYQISAISSEKNNPFTPEVQETGNNNLPTDSKLENNDATT